MNRVTLDAELRKKLNDGRSTVTVCDEAGTVLGEYVPAEEMRRRLMYAEAIARFEGRDYSADRAEMIANGFQGASSADILAAIAARRQARNAS